MSKKDKRSIPVDEHEEIKRDRHYKKRPWAFIIIAIILLGVLAFGCKEIYNGVTATASCNGVNQSYTEPVNSAKDRDIPITALIFSALLIIGLIKIKSKLYLTFIVIVLLGSIGYTTAMSLDSALGSVGGGITQCNGTSIGS